MKLEKKQRFSIRKYAVGAASVLIGFAFSAQVVAADGITPAPTAEETVQTIQESPQAVKETVDSKVPEKLEEKADKPVKEDVHSISPLSLSVLVYQNLTGMSAWD
mgnify:CR=1 FL=1